MRVSFSPFSFALAALFFFPYFITALIQTGPAELVNDSGSAKTGKFPPEAYALKAYTQWCIADLSDQYALNLSPSSSFTVLQRDAENPGHATKPVIRAAASATDAGSTKSHTATQSASASSKPKKSSGVSAGAIAGIVVGIIAFIAIVLGIVVFLVILKRRRRLQKAAQVVKMPTWYGDSAEAGHVNDVGNGESSDLSSKGEASRSPSSTRKTLDSKKSTKTSKTARTSRIAELDSEEPERRIEVDGSSARVELPN